VFSGDMGFGNLSKDKVARTRPPTTVRPLKPNEVRGLLLRGGLPRRIAFEPPKAACRKGWSVDIGTNVGITAEFDAAHNIRHKLVKAVGAARKDGGCHLLPVTRGSQDLSQPLEAGPREISAVHVVPRDQCIPMTWEDDPHTDAVGLPRTWDVTITRGNVSVPLGEVHRSRLVYIPGVDLVDGQQSPVPGYDWPIIEFYWTALRDLGLQLSAGVHLGVSLSEEYLNIKAGRSVMAGSAGNGGQGGSVVQKALQLYNMSRSVMGTKVLLGDDEVGRSNATVAGFRDLILAFYEAVATVEGIPLVKLFGMPPAGMTSDDESATRTWLEFLATMQSDELAPALLALYDIAFGPDASRVVTWAPLTEPTATEEANLELTRVQAASQRIVAGITTEAEERTRYTGPEVLPMPIVAGAIDEGADDDDLDEAEPDPPGDDEDDEQQAA
jgi:hypothetical protein